MVNSKPAKLFSNKLEFSSSDDEEISEMLRAHNKRVQHKTVNRIPIEPSSFPLITEKPGPQVMGEGVSSKNVQPEMASKTVKRRSCAPMLMKNKSSRCNSGLPRTVPDTISESTKSGSVALPLSSAISPQLGEFKATKDTIATCKNDSSKISSSGKLSRAHQTQVGAGILRKPALQKKPVAILSKKHAVNKSDANSNAVNRKCTSTSTCKVVASKASTQNNTKKAAAASKPVIKSTISKRPPTANTLTLANKVSSAAPKTQNSAKNSLTSKKLQSNKDLSRKTPLSQIQNRSSHNGPFGASNNVMSIINSKTPGKDRLKSKTREPMKPRYSVETPSPSRVVNCESSDDEDLDAFITSKLKAHNAKVEAKMIANHRIPGKATKSGKKVSLHLGSPSRPKMKPIRHKD